VGVRGAKDQFGPVQSRCRRDLIHEFAIDGGEIRGHDDKPPGSSLNQQGANR
jgi:hypothetical protein